MRLDLFGRPALLFLPASRASAISRARTSGADVVILDLEDAVRPEDKETARSAAVALAAPAATQQPPIDPLTARVDSSAADRFAALWRKTGGKPTAAQLQSDYLANGGPAIAVFTPGRINSAERLAAKIAEKPELYGDAVERCLPWVAGTNAQLRAAYLGLKGLFPAKPLPKIAVVVGRDNSGGTAGNGMQVIGLEVICRLSPTRAAFEERMRQFFAHETVHTLQRIDSPAAISSATPTTRRRSSTARPSPG